MVPTPRTGGGQCGEELHNHGGPLRATQGFHRQKFWFLSPETTAGPGESAPDRRSSPDSRFSPTGDQDFVESWMQSVIT